MKDLESDYVAILNHFFYNIGNGKTKTERLVADWLTPDVEVELRHNFQRQNLRNQTYLRIYYRGMVIADVKRYPKRSCVLQRRLPGKAPKGYFATKVLERVLWYRFPDVGVQ